MKQIDVEELVQDLEIHEGDEMEILVRVTGKVIHVDDRGYILFSEGHSPRFVTYEDIEDVVAYRKAN